MFAFLFLLSVATRVLTIVIVRHLGQPINVSYFFFLGCGGIGIVDCIVFNLKSPPKSLVHVTWNTLALAGR